MIRLNLDATEKDIKEYLSDCLIYWRAIKESPTHSDRRIAMYYIDAYQSVYISLFGETLQEDDNGT